LRIIWLAGWLCVCAWQDCTGYLGAALGSEVVGWLFTLLGWGAVFGLLFLVALSSLLCVTALAWATTPALVQGRDEQEEEEQAGEGTETEGLLRHESAKD
jgi:uncharacterized protein (DUF58 family)